MSTDFLVRLEYSNQLIDSGKYNAALQELDDTPPDIIMARWLNNIFIAHEYLNQPEKAFHLLKKAKTFAIKYNQMSELAFIYISFSRFYISTRQQDKALDYMHQALVVLEDNAALQMWVMGFMADYYTRILKLDQANHYAEIALARTRIHKKVRSYQAGTLAILSEIARLKGDFPLSELRAQQGLKIVKDIWHKRILCIHLGHSKRINGDYLGSLHPYHLALSTHPEGPDLFRTQAMLKLAEKQLGIDHTAQFKELIPQLPDKEATRIELHLADLLLKNGKKKDALTLVRAALDRDEPAQVQDEVWLLEDLYQHARNHGLNLPFAPERITTPTIHIQALGTPTITVNGRTVPVLGGSKVVALLAYLHASGVTPWERVVTELLGVDDPERGYGQVKYLLSQARHMIGDGKAVILNGGRVSLSERWTWSCDLSQAIEAREKPRALLLPDLYLDWVLERRAQIGQD